jgi:hypothetical protein
MTFSLTDAVLGMMDPVLVTDLPTLTRYAEALRGAARAADNLGHTAMAARRRARADYLLTLAR